MTTPFPALRTIPALLVAVALSVASGAGAPARAAGGQVGWVESLSDDARGVTVTRQGRSLEVMPLMPLQAEDTVSTAAGTLTLVISGAAPVRIDAAHSPYVVRANSQGSDLWSRMLGFAANQLTGTSNKPTGTVLAIARSLPLAPDPLRSALLSAPATQVAADGKPFPLAWQGGDPPYEVRIVADGAGGVVYRASGLTAPMLAADWRPTPGTYSVNISDGTGQTVRGGIGVVAPAQLPGAPSELTLNGFPGAAREMLYALWLIEQDADRWTLEAYRRLVSVGADLPSAQRLAGQLAENGVQGRKF